MSTANIAKDGACKVAMSDKVKVVVVGCGNMGSSHARAYKKLDGFEVVGLVDREPEKRSKLGAELGVAGQFDELKAAIDAAQPETAAICTYPDTHAQLAIEGLNAGLHVFVEKPIAEAVEEAKQVVTLAQAKGKKVVVGYILRHHPAWMQFIEIARTLGKPLVMRMNLNQQSKGVEWDCHKHLLDSMSPIVDCGVHYVDVMCQMTRCKPIRVQAIGTRLSDEIREDMYNYGQLQVVFEDGSVGWYEAGWGPMMSEVAFFVKDVVGPKGCVSIVEPEGAGKTGSADIDAHTKTNCLRKHEAELDSKGDFVKQDVLFDTSDEPDHQELCNREQAYFLKAIQEDIDLSEHLQDAVNSLRIVLAADESVRTGQVVSL
jgi:predicted dehydrogenase